MEWKYELEQLLKTKLPTFPGDHIHIPDRHYEERNREKRSTYFLNDTGTLSEEDLREDYEPKWIPRVRASLNKTLRMTGRKPEDFKNVNIIPVDSLKRQYLQDMETARVNKEKLMREIKKRATPPNEEPNGLNEIIKLDFKAGEEVRRDHWALQALYFLIPITSVFACSPNEHKQYKKRLADLIRLERELDKMDKLELYFLRISSQGYITTQNETDKDFLLMTRAHFSTIHDWYATQMEQDGLPNWDYTAGDIMQYIFNPVSSFAVYDRAMRISYERRIGWTKERIREKLSEDSLMTFMKKMAEENSFLEISTEIHNMKPRITEWQTAITETKYACMIANIPTSGESRTRNKRGLVETAVGEIAKYAISSFTGNVVSNLISSLVERFNPNSDFNRLNRIEAAFQEIQNNFIINKQADRGMLENIDKLSNIVQESVRRLNQHLAIFPEYTWLSSLIVNKMGQATLDLQRIADEAMKGRIALEPFSRLTGLHELRQLNSKDSKLLSVSRINDHIINFKFIATVESPDTSVYRVFAFDHWDNLDGTPRLLTYKGGEYLIYNETSNCVKSLPETPETHLAEQCTELDGDDPALRVWTTKLETEDIESYSNQSKVKKTLTHNYIYCFPGNISIEGTQYKCPYEVFKLPTNKNFRTATQRHVPSMVAWNATMKEIAIEAIHAGHYPADSDVVQHLALFEQLRNERRKLEGYLQEPKEFHNNTKGWGRILDCRPKYGMLRVRGSHIRYYGLQTKSKKTHSEDKDWPSPKHPRREDDESAIEDAVQRPT